MIRIIVAEDIDSLREDLVEQLEKTDDMCVVGQAASGAEAIALANTVAFDIALLDIEMETSNGGIRAAKYIMEKKSDVNVIYLSIHETEEIIIAAMATNASDYIIKGCSPEELYMHIRSVYEGNSMMNEKIRKIIMKEYQRLRKSEESLLYFINNISRLTAVEQELIKYLLQGYNVAQIAKARFVEVVTVKTQINGILRKFGCSRTKEIVKMIRDMQIEHLFL